MTSLTTQQHYEMPGGTLRVILTTDHTLTSAEREELDRIAVACTRFQEVRRAIHAGGSGGGEDVAASEVDEAIWELGGEQDILAG
jgi:hypothetical protein